MERQPRETRSGLTLAQYLDVLEPSGNNAAIELSVGRLPVGRVELRGGRPVHAELPGAVGDKALELLARIPRSEVSLVEPERCRRTLVRPWRGYVGKPGPLSRGSGQLLRLAVGASAVWKTPAGEVLEERAEVVSLHPQRHAPKSQTSVSSGADTSPSRSEKAIGKGVTAHLDTSGVGPANRGPRVTTEGPVSPVTEVNHRTLRPSSDPKDSVESSRPPGDEFDHLFRRSMSAYTSRNYAMALELTERCHALRPQDRRVRHNLERLRLRVGPRPQK